MDKKLLDLAIKAALHSADTVLSKRELTINRDQGKDIKLQADLESEKVILSYLKSSGINILSEESGFTRVSTNSEYIWIIDPLDGSLNYSRNIPLSCISIALWFQEEPVMGVVYDFERKRVYSGVVGEGAFVDNTKIKVSNVSKVSKSIITTGFPVYSSFDEVDLHTFIQEIQNYKKVRLLGSAALSLALVASGSVEAYKENNIALWDVAAGIALVLAAGGSVNYSFTDHDNHLLKVYATNGSI
jgi:myo-inositol-1(or 4)-monophosphatase